MSTSTPHRLIAAFTAIAGVVAAAMAVFLVGDSFRADSQFAQHAARVKDVLITVPKDALAGADLNTQFTRQMESSVARDRARNVRGWVLLAASALFLAGTKWLMHVHPAGPRAPSQIVALHLRSVGSSPPPPAKTCAPPTSPEDLAPIEPIVAQAGRTPAAVIPILQAIQAHYRYLPEAALRRVCELTAITPAQIASVASFYTQFRRTPVGEHIVTICHGTACHVAGGARVTDEFRRRLGLAPGQDTTGERDFTVQSVPCLGCCTLAPVVQVDGQTHGHTRPDDVLELLHPAGRVRCADQQVGSAVRTGRSSVWATDPAGEIRLGLGSCCVAKGSQQVREALLAALADSGVCVAVKTVGCVGMCHQTPFLDVRRANQPPKLYARVEPQQAAAIVRRHFQPDGRARRALVAVHTALRAGRSKRCAPPRPLELRDPPLAAFLGRQVHIATEHCGALDPLDLDEYRAHDGFKALDQSRRHATPPDVIELIKRSGLRGRGGAGYPTWQKWAAVRHAPSGDPKYVICNGDEGDPGAFMDRMLMESYPYRIIEGLAIAAHAVGAEDGFFYIRAEYPLAVERVSTAIERCTACGLLRGGDDGPGLRLRVFQGAGAFVCGEETALIASIEGQRGAPRLRPPYPAERGLWDRPTLVNNVETLAVVPWILRNGPAAFAAHGTPASKGTKVFALTGRVRRGGLIEVPMGITIREIVEGIGGGIKDEQQPPGRVRCADRSFCGVGVETRSHTFKAVQIGGPSGGCLPAALADTPVDYEALTAVGAIMGSGGLVVLDETDCMVDVARYFLTFTQEQSCGKCTPCRIGTRRMLDILDRLCTGAGRPDDLAVLEELGRIIAASSLCGLGKTAPNPVLSTLRYFREEYEAHVAGRCPAGRCKDLIRYEVTAACTGCTICAQHCPTGAIALQPYERHEIDAAKCTRCDVCRIRCPENAIQQVGSAVRTGRSAVREVV